MSEDRLEVNAQGTFEVCVLRHIKNLCTRTQLRFVSMDTIEVGDFLLQLNRHKSQINFTINSNTSVVTDRKRKTP